MCDGVRKADKRVLPVHYRPASPARQPRGLKCSDPIRTIRFGCFDAWRTIRAPSSDRTVRSAIGAIMTSHHYLTGLLWCRNANLAEFPLAWQEAWISSQSRIANSVSANAIGACPIAANCAACPACKPDCRRCLSNIRSSRCSTAGTGRPPPACSNRIGSGPCTWKKTQRASDKNGSHSFRCEPWQRSIKGWRTRFDRADRVRRSRHLNASTNGRNRPSPAIAQPER